MRKSFIWIVLTVIFSASTNVLAADDCVLPVNNTVWDVSEFLDDGIIRTPHPTPWIFQKHGTASALGYWTATWKRIACDKIQMNLNNGADIHDVIFVTSKRFVAIKNDSLYRFGKKR